MIYFIRDIVNRDGTRELGPLYRQELYTGYQEVWKEGKWVRCPTTPLNEIDGSGGFDIWLTVSEEDAKRWAGADWETTESKGGASFTDDDGIVHPTGCQTQS